jgi:hypothetical protein
LWLDPDAIPSGRNQVGNAFMASACTYPANGGRSQRVFSLRIFSVAEMILING